MSFFANSSGIYIYGGNFTGWFYYHYFKPLIDSITADGTQVLGKIKDHDSCETDDYTQDDDLRKRRRCSSSDGLKVCQQRPLPVAELSYFTIMPSF